MAVDVLMREDLARDAIAAAARVRRKARLSTGDPVPIFDLVQSMGIELRFAALASLEAMYSSSPRAVIVVSSLRPAGRQRYGCAHELGHHVFGHGMCIEEFKSGQLRGDFFDEREFLAEVFAGALLMPKSSVTIALRRRGLGLDSLSPEQAYALAAWFGVGYTTFLHHVRSGLRLTTSSTVAPLLRTPTAIVKQRISGIITRGEVVPIDRFLGDRAVDVATGDLIVVFDEVTFDGPSLRVLTSASDRVVLIADAPGLFLLQSPAWSALARVCRREYAGRAGYRFLEETADE